MKKNYDYIDSSDFGTIHVETSNNKDATRSADSKTYVFDRRILSEYRKILAPENGRLMLRSMMDTDVLVMEMDGRDITIDLLDCIPRPYTLICWGHVKSSLIIPKNVQVSGYESNKEARVTVLEDQVVIIRFTAAGQDRFVYWFAEVDGETDHVVMSVQWGDKKLIPNDDGMITIPYNELIELIDEKIKVAVKEATLYWNS